MDNGKGPKSEAKGGAKPTSPSKSVAKQGPTLGSSYSLTHTDLADVTRAIKKGLQSMDFDPASGTIRAGKGSEYGGSVSSSRKVSMTATSIASNSTQEDGGATHQDKMHELRERVEYLHTEVNKQDDLAAGKYDEYGATGSRHDGLGRGSKHGGFNGGSKHGGFDGGSRHGGFDGGSRHGGFDGGSRHGGFDGGSRHTGIDGEKKYSGFDSGSKHGGFRGSTTDSNTTDTSDLQGKHHSSHFQKIGAGIDSMADEMAKKKSASSKSHLLFDDKELSEKDRARKTLDMFSTRSRSKMMQAAAIKNQAHESMSARATFKSVNPLSPNRKKTLTLSNKKLTVKATHESVKEYLIRHKIKEMFDMLLASLVIDKPDSPVDYLLKMAREMNRQRKIESNAELNFTPCPCDGLRQAENDVTREENKNSAAATVL